MRTVFSAFILVLVVVMAGCSVDSGIPAVQPTVKVSGVAAAGSPLLGKVYLKDAGFQNLSTATAEDGSFSFEAASLKKPLLLKVCGAANGRSYLLYSLSEAGGTANINPLSSVVTSYAAGGDAGALYDAPNRSAFQSAADGVAKSLGEVRASLAPLLKAYDAATINPITDPYLADHTRLDRLFDLVTIDIGNGNLTVTNNLTGTTILAAPVTAVATAPLAQEFIPLVPKTAKGKWHLKKSLQISNDSSGNGPTTKTSSYFYDTAGDLTSVAETVTTPETSSTSRTDYLDFDAHGNPAGFQTVRQSGSASYEYDAGGRLIKKTGTVSVNFPNGRLYYTMTYASNYAYNADGSYQVRTVSTKTFGTDLHVLLTEVHDYDSRGNLLSYSYNGEKVLSYSYAYDANGNATTAVFTNSENGAKGTATYEWLYF